MICLDPGHGGPDSGATNTVDGIQYQENSCNLKIALAARKYLLEYAGVDVVMTRETLDKELSLAQRVAFATKAGAHVVVSIHNNSYSDPATRGSVVCAAASTYRPELSLATRELGKSILNSLNTIGLQNRGLLTTMANTSSYHAFYPDGSLQDYYGIVMRSIRSGVPGIVVECSFISSPADVRDYLSTDEKLDSIGLKIAEGIAAYYGLSKDTPYVTEPRIPIDGTHLTFDQPHLRALFYPYNGTTVSGTDEAVLANENGNVSAFLDYFGMAPQTKEYSCAVLRLKGTPGAKLKIYAGVEDIITPQEDFCYEITLSGEYADYALNLGVLPVWIKSFNFFQFELDAGNNFSVSDIRFKASAPSGALLPADPTPTPTPSPTSTPSPTPTPTPSPTPTPEPTPEPTPSPTSTPVITETPGETATPVETVTVFPSPEETESTVPTAAPTDEQPENTSLPAPSASQPEDPTEDPEVNGKSKAFVVVVIVVAAAAIVILGIAAVFIFSVPVRKRKNGGKDDYYNVE